MRVRQFGAEVTRLEREHNTFAASVDEVGVRGFTSPRAHTATPPAPHRYCTCYYAIAVRVCAGQTRIAATAQSQTTIAQDLTRLRHELARHAHADAVAARAAGDFHTSGMSASLGHTATNSTVDSYAPQ